jgi:tetraacyldisaccharide 4'-kinase
MNRVAPTRSQRLERFLLRLIQHEGDDQGHPRSIRLFLGLLDQFSKVFTGITRLRAWSYRTGLSRRYPLGCQVISVGNVTVGGTGKTPVVEILARTLRDEGRKVAILSRGYRKKERPFLERLLGREKAEPPRIVSDGNRVLLDSELSGDEPYMLASNLPGVVVLVDKDRVKSGRYAISRFGCDVLILDDGFQYMRLKHTHEIVLVDSTNPFGNGHLLPRGILREDARNIRRADFIFITKSDGDTELLRARLRRMNPRAEITECRHCPRYYKNVNTGEILPLEKVRGMKVVSLAGIAAPISFETSIRRMGGQILANERYSDHYRYKQQDILDVVNEAADLGADAIFTTEKDAVRLPHIEKPLVPIYYMRMEIEILKGYENFKECVARICFSEPSPEGGA